MANVFKVVGDFFKKVLGWLSDPEVQKKAADIFHQVQHYVPMALTAVETVNAIAPNRTLSELVSLSHKYNLQQWASADDDQIRAMLQKAALEELRGLVGSEEVSTLVLNTAINIAVGIMRAKQ